MTLAKQRNYELVLPTHYVDVDQDDMEYVDGGGWIQWQCALIGGIAGAIAAGIAGAIGGAAIGMISIPVIGSVSMAFIGAAAGIALGFMTGVISGWDFGGKIERTLTRTMGWKF